jgi:hypothetical protein
MNPSSDKCNETYSGFVSSIRQSKKYLEEQGFNGFDLWLLHNVLNLPKK